MKQKRVKLSISITVVILLIELSSVFIGGAKAQQPQQSSQRQLSISENLPSSSSSSLTKIFNQVENSVVQVISTIEPGNNSNLRIIINGNPITRNQTALGSGFVYDKQGHIVTNNHVVSNASKVDVTFVDGNTYSAKVVGKDSYSILQYYN